MIDFTTTACIRPEILRKTYESFNENLKDIDLKKCRLIINIDPLPKFDKEKIDEMEEICNSFFGKVLMNVPDEPNFTKAINWCWSNADTDFIFHLEDDWFLMDPIFSHEYEDKISKKHTYQVVLKAYERVYTKFCLSPSFITKKVYASVAGNLDESINPEIQFRGKKFDLRFPCPENKIPNDDKILAVREQVVLLDLGRDWIRNTGFKKPSQKYRFNKWLEIK